MTVETFDHEDLGVRQDTGGSRTAVDRRLLVAALVAALGTAMLGLPHSLEGARLLDVSHSHGITATDLVAAALILAGLASASRRHGARLWRWAAAPGRSFLLAAAAGVGVGATLLGDEARWVWLLSAVLVHLACLYQEHAEHVDTRGGHDEV